MVALNTKNPFFIPRSVSLPSPFPFLYDPLSSSLRSKVYIEPGKKSIRSFLLREVKGRSSRNIPRVLWTIEKIFTFNRLFFERRVNFCSFLFFCEGGERKFWIRIMGRKELSNNFYRNINSRSFTFYCLIDRFVKISKRRYEFFYLL